jgi:hypothetical protein
MKLFKSLLVAPAALGLLAPMSATANELNVADFNDYSSSKEVQNISEFNSKQLAVTNSRVDGLETRINNFEAGSFSETTTASFSADFAIGSVDGVGSATDSKEAVSAAYSFQIDLNTSFTGEDSFDVSIDAGNAGSGSTAGSFPAFDELDLNDGGDGLTVDGISYTFPVGDKTTVFVGDNVDGSSLYSTACVYGSPTDTMDDCGLASSAIDDGSGTAFGASIELGNGFTAAVGFTGDGTSSNGLFTKEGNDSYGAQLTYTDDSYGASLTYANVESTNDTTYWGLNGYWTPDSTGSAPSISVGYEMGDPASGNDTTQYFVGLQWDEVGPGTLGLALGNTGPIADGATEYNMYEVFYNYPVNDGMTITPVIYSREDTGANDDDTGVLVKTSFSF